MISSLDFLREPRPWTDDIKLRLATKELVATGLYEIAAIKGRLVSSEIPGPHKLQYADALSRWITLIRECYNGPLPEPMSDKELAAYRRKTVQ
jgi:hypothetical protein